jgi:hypothetical protein
MQSTRHKRTITSPRSVGNVAFTEESLGVLQIPTTKTHSPVRVVGQRSMEDELEALVPTIRIINGIRLSITLLSLLIVIIYCMYVIL